MSWDPFFDRFFGPSVDERDRCIEPLADITENDDEIVITVDLPFVASKEDIEVYVSDKSVEITAKTKRGIKWNRWSTHYRYMEFNQFRKRIELPVKVDVNDVKATFRNGILLIRLRKKKERVLIKLD